MKLKLPNTYYNWLSLVGTTIAIIALFMIIFLFFISTFIEHGSSYLGLIVYIILPGFLLIGLILIPIGMYLKYKREKKAGIIDKSEWPRVDLNNKTHRNAFIIFIIGTTILLFASAVGSYEAFHYTESVEFCGKTCHSVMKPEYVAYQNSPHARVACVECHVGSGADWYVKSKLSGMYQVYAVTLGTVPRPIPTPIENLRPSRETCERCHWPQKFYAHQIRNEKHFLSDEQNTEWDINLVMKIGSSHSALGLQEGIHWHINPNVLITYAAADSQRQRMAWVKYKDLRSGKEILYTNEEDDPSEFEGKELISRTMECIDCHNRPSHNYKPPAFFVNSAMTAGTIPKNLPGIKSLTMQIAENEFTTEDSAMQFIRTEIENYYRENHSDIFESQNAMVQKAITGFQNEFKKNIFPEMRVRWNVYPNNIGHLEFDGCFRCHNDKFKATTGEVIKKDCNLCHSIVGQGTKENFQSVSIDSTLEFVHPEDIGDAWQEELCTSCHTGLAP